MTSDVADKGVGSMVRSAIIMAVVMLAASASAVTSASAAPSVVSPTLHEGSDAAVTVGRLNANVVARCGKVSLTASVAPNTQLPASIWVSEPSRGLARQQVASLSSPGDRSALFATNTLFGSAASGTGPGLVVELVEPTGTTVAVTESYIDNCPGTLFPIAPTRVLDTRVPIGITTRAKVSAGSVTQVDLASITGAPSGNVTAIAANLTAAEAESNGYLTLFPCASGQGSTSSLNFTRGRTIANFALVDVVGNGSNGPLCVFASAATHVLIDVTGYVLDNRVPLPEGGRYNALAAPGRLADTRGGSALSAGETRRVRVLGERGVPQAGVTSAMLNVTALNSVTEGYLSVFPCGAEPPNASTLNFVGPAPTPNATIVGIGDGGDVCVFSPVASDVLVDVSGYFAPTGSDLTAFRGVRIRDTRMTGKLTPNTATPFPAAFTTSLLLNVVIDGPEGDGYAVVHPCDVPAPDSSNLNFLAGQTVANGAFVRTDANRNYCITSTQPAWVIIDWTGSISTPSRAPA